MTYNTLPDPMMQEEFYAETPTKRLIAWVIDMVIILILSAAVIPFTAFTGIFFFPLLVLVIGFIYRTVTLAAASATIGMRLMAIEFRTREGSRFDTASALLHTFGYSVSIGMPLLQTISVVLMLTSARRQGLTDMIMGSVCLNRPARH